MPGIPTGRGCDACRKQKKKCIFDETDRICSRCARLEIDCIGLGQRRFMFKEEYGSTALAKTKKQHKPKRPPKSKASGQHESSSSPQSDTSFDSNGAVIEEIVRVTSPPSNPLTVLTKAFISAMAPETDLRYNLKWAYSGYLGLVPSRLGVNEALDTAVDALVTTHRAFACRREITVSSLTKYSKALSSLRRCLDDPLRAGISETLCAVTILLIVQGIQNPLEHKRTGHAEGAARILKARKHFAPRDDFESMLLLSLRGPILFEGLFNPHIHLTPQEWKDLVESDLDSGMSEGKMLRCLSRIPNILQRARSIDLTNDEQRDTIFTLQEELRDLYTTARSICDEFRARLLELEAPGALHTVAAVNPLLVSPEILHAHYQRTYGFAIIIASYINYTMVNMCAGENDVRRTLNLDAAYLAQEMLGIAENAVVYRPFGAAFVSLGLVAARMAVGAGLRHEEGIDAHDKPLKDKLDQSYLDYQMDFNGRGYELRELEGVFSRLRPLEMIS